MKDVKLNSRKKRFSYKSTKHQRSFKSETKHVDDVSFHGLSVGSDCLLKNSDDSIET
jgi:hypothetical protein